MISYNESKEKMTKTIEDLGRTPMLLTRTIQLNSDVNKNAPEALPAARISYGFRFGCKARNLPNQRVSQPGWETFFKEARP